MRQRAAILRILVILGTAMGGSLNATGSAFAQAQPDFSGTWTQAADPSASTTAKPAPAALGQQFSIVQDASTLTLTRSFAGTTGTIRYTLDGSQTASRMPGRVCEPDSSAAWTASWEGQAIVIALVGVTPPNGKTMKADVRTTLKLEAPDTMRVEAVARTAGQSAPRTTTTIYKRTGAAPAPGAALAVQPAKATIGQVAWIGGTWTGTQGSSSIEERWTPPAGGSMLAISRTLRDGVMSAFEFLCIVERDGGLVYTAMPNARTPATDFTLTRIDESSATFENPAHDFPKIIRYTRKADGSLEAVVSGAGGEKPQTFVFQRQ
jgi:hypothetical protein